MPGRVNSLGIDYKAVFNGQYARLLIGQVRKINPKDQSRKVKCVKLSLDPKLLKYWSVRKHFRAEDTTCNSSVGDIVVIKQFPTPHGHLISHRVQEVIFRNGAVVDPITGKLCHTVDYSEQVENPKLNEYLNQKESEVISDLEVYVKEQKNVFELKVVSYFPGRARMFPTVIQLFHRTQSKQNL